MRLFIIVTLAVFMAAGALIACNSNETLLTQNTAPPTTKTPPPGAATPGDSARRITAEEVHKLWEKGDVVIIDTRAEPAYKQEHIKGSISMPTGTVLQRIDELPKNKMIVAYCT
jgi:3-mercaptopyruvate sulfurtransferase SseA